jgi:diguanylate cyclase (GGDEF)-like protein/PAS domain S-box-containing protein
MDISPRLDAVYQAHQQVLNLYRQPSSGQHPDFLDAALSHLDTVLEELRTAYEELQQQNQALTDYRQQLEAERQRYQDLFDLAPDGYLVTNATGMIQEANVAIATMIQVSQEYLIGKPLLLFLPESDRPAIRTILNQLPQPQPSAPPPRHTWETQLYPRGGTPISVGLTLTYSYQRSSGGISHIRWSFRDITQQKVAEAKIHRQAFYDSLTELPNRALLEIYLPKTLAQAQRQNMQVAIAFLDLDLFKHINDTFGHSIGDGVLRQVGQRLRQCLRAGDLLVRWGGDEFIIVLASVHSLGDVSGTCDRFIASLQPAFNINHHPIHISTSFGIAFYPDHGQDPETLLRCADQALYQAKNQGRNTYAFYSTNSPQSPSLDLQTRAGEGL